METISAWASANAILAWLVAGVAALALVYGLYLSWVIWDNIDRSGTKLVIERLSVGHDTATDEVVFTWPVNNEGKYLARELHVFFNFNSRQNTGLTVVWRLARTIATLKPEENIAVELRISRHELVRLSRDFKSGSISLTTNYSSTPRHKPPRPFGTFGPCMRYALSVGYVGDEACVTVTDFTPVASSPDI